MKLNIDVLRLGILSIEVENVVTFGIELKHILHSTIFIKSFVIGDTRLNSDIFVFSGSNKGEMNLIFLQRISSLHYNGKIPIFYIICFKYYKSFS